LHNSAFNYCMPNVHVEIFAAPKITLKPKFDSNVHIDLALGNGHTP